MSTAGRGDVTAAMRQLGITNDDRDEYSVIDLIGHVQGLLDAAQVRHRLGPAQVAVVRVAAAQLLQGLHVRPVMRPFADHEPPAEAGSAGQEKGSQQ